MDHKCATPDPLMEASGVAAGEISRNSMVAPKASTGVREGSAVPIDALVLSDGTRLRLRPIGSDDRAGLAGLFARLSPESRRRRFLCPKRELTSRELTYLTDIDHICHEAIAAVDQRDGSIVGVGRYAHDADRPSVAEVAVAVTDELQGMGIGTALSRAQCSAPEQTALRFSPPRRCGRTGPRALSCDASGSALAQITAAKSSTSWSSTRARTLWRRFSTAMPTTTGTMVSHPWITGTRMPSTLSAPEDPDSAIHRGIDAIRRRLPPLGVTHSLTSASRSTRPKRTGIRCSPGFASLAGEQRAACRSTWSWPTSAPRVRGRAASFVVYHGPN